MINFELKHPQATREMLGYIPGFLNEHDKDDAVAQLHKCYAHGGGWCPFEGFTMLPNGNLQYPGDPPTRLLAEGKLRKEVIRIYEHAWVAVVQPDGAFIVARMD